MISLKQARKIQPELESLSDDEVLELIRDMRMVAQLVCDQQHKDDSNNLERVLTSNE